MKIPLSIRQLYAEQIDSYNNLQKKVDDRIKSLKVNKWHYESRVKSVESYALKLETGRVNDPRKLEDFFACTLVVENIKTVEAAEKFIEKEFEKQSRKPRESKFTHKKSDAFPFDDLRLYVKWKDDPILPHSGLSHMVFEVQIKTFLQHAWGIATHDFIYKNDNMSWGKERIAYQIKAMLEHAELSILEADKLAASSVLDKTNRESRELSNIIILMKQCWDKEGLPDDVVRLSRNVMSLINAVGINVKKLKEIINAETERGNGTKTMSLSPYGVILQSLLNREKVKMCDFLAKDDIDFKMLVTKELDLPKSITKDNQKNVIDISSS